MSDLSQFFYVSHIVGPLAFETMSSIVAEARPLNAVRGLSGLLVFDGAHVCQYVEGERAEVEALAARLARDARHERMQVLHHAPLDGPRRFSSWRLGYLALDDGMDLSRFEDLSGPSALQALLDLIPAIDLDP